MRHFGKKVLTPGLIVKMKRNNSKPSLQNLAAISIGSLSKGTIGASEIIKIIIMVALLYFDTMKKC